MMVLSQMRALRPGHLNCPPLQIQTVTPASASPESRHTGFLCPEDTLLCECPPLPSQEINVSLVPRRTMLTPKQGCLRTLLVAQASG